MTRTATHWGKGKNQVHALKSKIIALLRQGESLESAFHILTKEKKLTIGARTFHRHAAAFRDEALASPLPLSQLATRFPSTNNSAFEPTRKSAVTPDQPSTPKPVNQTSPKRGGFSHKADGGADALNAAYGSPGTPQAKTDAKDPKRPAITQSKNKKSSFAAGLHKSEAEINAMFGTPTDVEEIEE